MLKASAFCCTGLLFCFIGFTNKIIKLYEFTSTNWNLLIKNFLYRIIIVFCDQGNLFSIRSVTIYDLMIILFQLFSCTIRIIKPRFDIRGM